MYAVDAVRVPRLGLLYGTEEHLVHAERVGTVFLDNHIRVHHVEHGLAHLLYRPSADVLAVFEDELCRVVFGTPCLEGFHVQHIVRYDVHVHVERGGVVLVFQVQRHKRIGVLDAVDEVAPSLNHALVHQLLEWLFHGGDVDVVQELVPEAGVNQVSGGMFGTSYIEVHVAPVFVHLLVNQCRVVARVHVAQVVSAGACESRHGVQFQGEDGDVVYLFVLYHAVVHRVPCPAGGVSQRRLACFGRQELRHFGQFQWQAAFGEHVGHVVLVVNGERFAPITLTREDGVAQAEVHLDTT